MVPAGKRGERLQPGPHRERTATGEVPATDFATKRPTRAQWLLWMVSIVLLILWIVFLAAVACSA